MPDIKTLREKFAAAMKAGDDITARYAENPAGITAEDREARKKAYDEAAALRDSIEAVKQASGLREWADDVTGQVFPLATGKSGDASLSGFEPAGGATVTDKGGAPSVLDDEGPGAAFTPKLRQTLASTGYKDAYREYLRKGINGLGATAYKTLQEGVDEQGGFLVPDDLLSRIVSRKPTPTRVAGRVTRIPTGRDRVVMPKVNYSADDIYTTGIRVTWTGERPSSSTVHRVTEPKFGQIGIPVYTAMLSMPLTNDLVEDAAFPIVSWSADKFRETVDLVRDDLTLNGSGIGQAAGILLDPDGTDQPSTVKTGHASLVTADGLQDIVWSVPEQYDENSAWVFNKTSTGAAIAKLKDAENRYLWANFESSGLMLPATQRPLLGYPVLFSAFMPNVAADAFPAIFGDLSGYFLVDRVGFSIQVLREVYAEDNAIVLLGRLRFGGQVAEPWKMKVHKVAA